MRVCTALFLVASLLVAPQVHAAPRAHAAERAEAAAERAEEAATRAESRRIEMAGRRVFLAARAECKRPGKLLEQLIEHLFDPAAFGSGVITGWPKLSEDQQRTFIDLADRVVGADERTKAIRQICAPGRLESVGHVAEHVVHVKVRQPGEGECTSLEFFEVGEHWEYGGVWFCGVTIRLRDRWKKRLGNGDYEQAIAALRALL